MVHMWVGGCSFLSHLRLDRGRARDEDARAARARGNLTGGGEEMDHCGVSINGEAGRDIKSSEYQVFLFLRYRYNCHRAFPSSIGKIVERRKKMWCSAEGGGNRLKQLF